MLCPNDNAMMHPTAVPSHYGQKVIIDQCEVCGGLWFDAFELYKINRDADELTERLDSNSLLAPSVLAPSDIDHPTLLCPRDQAALYQFKDPSFPKGIILMRCGLCQGFWLNRGDFAKYQQSRQALTRPKEKTLADEKLDSEVKQLLAAHRAGNDYDVLGKAGAFLSAPVPGRTVSPLDASLGLNEKQDSLNSILNVLTALLRLFIFR